jgi:hypothetical protein
LIFVVIPAVQSAGLFEDGWEHVRAIHDPILPTGGIFVITDNLSSHNNLKAHTRLEEHPRIHQVFISTEACWLNQQERWWRIFYSDALAMRLNKPLPSPLLSSISAPSPRSEAVPLDRRHYRRLFCRRM